jgi:2,4-dienoyl-CoA reductase-like NADH-dependent reductase (Old Yellow Enzyme family)
MQRNEFYPHLFQPIELAGRRLRNRIVHASISTHFMDRGAGTTARCSIWRTVRAAVPPRS